MKFGMNMLLWTDDPTKEEYLPVFERLKKIGFDGVELPIFNLDPNRFAALGKRLDDLGLERTGVTVRTVADNPISADAAVRAKGVELSKRVLDCCQAAGVRPCSPVPTMPPSATSAAPARPATSGAGASRACVRSPNTPAPWASPWPWNSSTASRSTCSTPRPTPRASRARSAIPTAA
jgi:sugar phosphate isomerase/epimerase